MCQRAAGLSYFSGLPKAKTAWGWLKGKFTNAAKVNLTEYDVESQSTWARWASATPTMPLGFSCHLLFSVFYLSFLSRLMGRVPVLFGYWDCCLAAFTAWALPASQQHGAWDRSYVLQILSRSRNCSEHSTANKNSKNPSLVTTSSTLVCF